MIRKRLLVAFTVTAVTAAGWAIWVNACDQDKQTSSQATKGRGAKVTAVTAGAGKGNCTAAMASQCTAAMAAECKTHGVNASKASMAECPHHTSAATASMAGHAGCSMKTSATTASMAGHDGCATKTSATTASMAGHDGCATKTIAATAGTNCESHGTSATAVAAKGGADCCAGKSAKGTTASKMGSMCNPSVMGAGMIGAPDCSSHGTTATVAGMEGDCDACAEMMTCGSQLASNGVQTQTVPLKNGVMFVYTTDTPAHVRAVQNAMARRNDRLNTLAQSGDGAKLCPQCKTARGAIASGKLRRETVNIDGGCMTLVTSSDAATVTQLRAMATTSNGRTKI